MSSDQRRELEVTARGVIDANQYMVLGTADEAGHPWVSPVWYAMDGYTDFYWVSSPEARHSRNLAVRPELSIVIFDSQVPIGTGQGVYMSAVAEQLSSAEVDRGMEVFSARSLSRGGRAWEPEEVGGTGLYRLYRARASEHWVLDPEGRPDHRTPVTP